MAQDDQIMGNETMTEQNDAIAMLHADHRQVDALFQQYADTPDPYLKQIIAEHVFAELELHMLLEETLFYPAFAAQVKPRHDILATSGNLSGLDFSGENPRLAAPVFPSRIC